MSPSSLALPSCILKLSCDNAFTCSKVSFAHAPANANEPSCFAVLILCARSPWCVGMPQHAGGHCLWFESRGPRPNLVYNLCNCGSFVFENDMYLLVLVWLSKLSSMIDSMIEQLCRWRHMMERLGRCSIWVGRKDTHECVLFQACFHVYFHYAPQMWLVGFLLYMVEHDWARLLSATIRTTHLLLEAMNRPVWKISWTGPRRLSILFQYW